jgi:hypothetical protein
VLLLLLLLCGNLLLWVDLGSGASGITCANLLGFLALRRAHIHVVGPRGLLVHRALESVFRARGRAFELRSGLRHWLIGRGLGLEGCPSRLRGRDLLFTLLRSLNRLSFVH